MKFYIKDVIDDIYVEGLTPYNKKHWLKFMEAWFEELHQAMREPDVNDIRLLRFATFAPKPVGTLKQLRFYSRLYIDGAISEEEMLAVAEKAKTIMCSYVYKTVKIGDIFESMVSELDERLGKTDWWANIRDAIRESTRKIVTNRRVKTIDAYRHGRGPKRE